MLWVKTSAFLVLALFAADFVQAQEFARLRRDDDGGDLLPNGRRGKIRRVKKLRQQGVGTARGFSQKPFVSQAPATDAGVKRGVRPVVPQQQQQQSARQAKAIDISFEPVKQPQLQQQFQQQQQLQQQQAPRSQQQLLPAPIQRVQQQLRPIQQFQAQPPVSKQSPAVQGFQQQQGLRQQQQAAQEERDEEEDEAPQLPITPQFVPNSIPRADVKTSRSQQQQAFLGAGSAQNFNRPLAPPVPIHTQDFTIDDRGNYQFNFETGDQVQRVESGQQITRGQDEKLQAIEGSYSYTGPDGKQYTVRYIADENGFQPIGDHIPRLPKVSRNPNIKQ